ncbi:DUF4142 domain-containing protein [Muricoccus aerilatus]|uniref:DUF4142 domain-containing protein n=1 Tax=Muricoccus aerilatus TaxID=452982 RepID=UPI000AEE285D|nr:DUF4142 domain-containing protein [Roseomonas aerilata]
MKRLAARMIEDHGRANQEMMQIARQKQVTPPSRVGADHQQVCDRLADLRGAAFE